MRRYEKAVDADHVESPRRGLGQAPRRHRRRHGAARPSAPPCPRPHLRPQKLAHAAAGRRTPGMRREPVKPRAACGSGATLREGGAIWVSPQTDRERDDRGLLHRSANPVIDARLALSARTRYNTSGRERPLLWPVLPCPPMAGFEVSTEAPGDRRWASGDLGRGGDRVPGGRGTALLESPHRERVGHAAREAAGRGAGPADEDPVGRHPRGRRAAAGRLPCVYRPS